MSDLRPDWNPGMTSPAPNPKNPRRRLGALVAHTGGNTLAIMAAALLPMTAMAGSAIDMSRLYVVKVRLQQACDAGALAGRKFMIGDTLDDNAKDQARKFFNNNFESGFFKSTNITFAPTDTGDGQVKGTASATVPMAIMQMFGKEPVKLDVTCEARLDLADADIMFVLDNTGSMACAASDAESSCDSYVVTNTVESGGIWQVKEKSNARIKALRLAVTDFYTTLKSSADASTHLRFGFVPYSSTVNVGKIIPANFIATTPTPYQTRRTLSDSVSSTVTNGASYANITSAACNAYVGRSPASGFPLDTTVKKITVGWTQTAAGPPAKGTCQTKEQVIKPTWRYEQISLDVSDFVAGSAVQNPSRITTSLNTWSGCIEERQTSPSSSFSQSSLPADLDIDLAPTSDATRWKAIWPEVVWDRDSNPEDTTDDNTNLDDDTPHYYNRTSCGKQASRLDTMSASQISNFVNDSRFRAMGTTYHDAGMIWGGRFLSPNGPFAADTAPWPNRNAPNRFIVFMTDGEMKPGPDTYGLYGFEKLDRRVMGGTTPTAANMKTRHNARFQAVCTAIKNHNITVFVVAFAQTMTTDLSSCASPGKAYFAANDTQLRDQFKQIATQIAELRLSK